MSKNSFSRNNIIASCFFCLSVVLVLYNIIFIRNEAIETIIVATITGAVFCTLVSYLFIKDYLWFKWVYSVIFTLSLLGDIPAYFNKALNLSFIFLTITQHLLQLIAIYFLFKKSRQNEYANSTVVQ